MDFLSYRLQKKCWLITISLQHLNPAKLSSDKIHRRDKPLTPAVEVPYINTAQLSEFVKCCNNACQELNVNKTKEILMTFSNKHRELTTAVIAAIHMFKINSKPI